MSKAPASFDFFYTNWIEGTDELSDRAYRCYMRLLIYQWVNGHLPIKELVRMNICKIIDKGMWDQIWDEIRHKFIPVEGQEIYGCEISQVVWVNPKMHELRESRLPEYYARIERAKKNGKKGGRPKKPTSVSEKTNVGFKNGVFENPEHVFQKPTLVRRKTLDVRSKTLEEDLASSINPGINSLEHKSTFASAHKEIPIKEMLARWNETDGALPVKDLLLSPVRSDALRIAIEHDPKFVSKFFYALGSFPLLGYFDGNRKVGFDSMLKPGFLDKVIEGQFSATKKKPRQEEISDFVDSMLGTEAGQ